jgi:high-affinity nickel-transport protein
VSAAFLLILALMNAWILYKLMKEMKRLISRSSEDEEVDMWNVQGAGCLMGVFKGAFKMIDRPWKMYPLGVLCE